MPQFVRDIDEIRRRAIRNIEEGAVTEAYELDPHRSISILNEALATEIVCVLRYMHHYFMATGVHAKAVSSEFKEHADEEREHADSIAERIQQLGGKPDLNPGTLVERSVSHYVEGETLADMIREDLIAERMVIEVYNEMIRFFGEKDPTTRIMLEHILAQEEEHASDLSDLMYVVEPSTGEAEGEDPGVRPLQLRRTGTDDREIAQREYGGSRQQQSGNRDRIRYNPERFQGGGQRQQGGTGRSNEGNSSDKEVDRYVGHLDRDPREPRPLAQTIADREMGNRRQQQNRGNQMSEQKRNQPHSEDLSNRQATEQFAGRGSVSASGKQTPTQGESELRPSRSQGRNRPDEDSAPPAHVPGTTGHTQHLSIQGGDAQDEPAEREHAGGMGGTNRSAHVTRPNKKNRAA